MRAQASEPQPSTPPVAAMDRPPVLVALQGVTVELEERLILDRVDLAVHAGEIVTLIGPNGAGKTTLLKVALGLLPPSRGRVALRPGVRVGYSPQQLAIDRTLPIDVKTFLGLAGRLGPGALEAVLEEVGLAGVGQRPMRALSGGELRRVLLARALLREPELLALDEPLSGVDLAGQFELYELIARVRRRRGCAVLLVSHDLHLVMAATDRVICLDRHVCCSGTPAAVARDAAFLDRFGDRVSRVVALYQHDHACRHDAAASGFDR